MPHEVRIKLTDSQRSKIKKATGKDMTELRVSSVGSNPAVRSAVKGISARSARSARAQAGEGAISARSARSARAQASEGEISARSARSARTTSEDF